MSSSTKVPTFLCDCDAPDHSACKGLPFYKKHEGKKYCVLHYPSKEKSAAFAEALKRKLETEDFDFRGVWFPDRAKFGGFTFTKPVNFINATFSEGAHFYSATFSAGAYFNSARFAADALFNSAIFNSNVYFFSAKFDTYGNFASARFDADADFLNTKFGSLAIFETATFNGGAAFNSVVFCAEALFRAAMFSTAASFFSARFGAQADLDSSKFSGEVSFHSATFSAEVSFRAATFKDYVRFAGDGNNPVFGNTSSLNLQFARIEKPDRLSFHTLTLRPQWFVNVDARRFEFINVNWDGLSNNLRIDTRHEIKNLENKVSSAHRLLSIACRNLAINAEENHRYEEASKFRYMAMDAQRLGRWRGFAFWTLGWWYWLASGYGERVWRAFVVLLGIWLLSAVLYAGLDYPNGEMWAKPEKATVEEQYKETHKWSSALLYSAGVMTLQKPEPRPATNVAQGLVMLETILGPVQAALLALAIRRKFMR